MCGGVMKNLATARWMYAKAAMFVLIGLTSAVLLIVQMPTMKTVALLAIAIWSVCRAYYFAFYVIEKYVDPAYRFSGLRSFVRYLTMKKKSRTGVMSATSD